MNTTTPTQTSLFKTDVEVYVETATLVKIFLLVMACCFGAAVINLLRKSHA